MADKEAKDLLAKAEENLKSPKGPLGSLLGQRKQQNSKMLNAPANTMVTWHKDSKMLDRACQSIHAQMPVGALDEFAKSTNRREEVDYMMNLKCVREMMTRLDIIMEFRNKYAQKAHSYRIEGNELFQKKYYFNALKSYNKAVLHAPLPENESADPSAETFPKELAFAFGNRSAALLHIKMYDLCLKDVDMALKYDYPMDTRVKLLDRKGKCFYYKKQKMEAEQSYEEAKRALENSEMETKSKESWIKTLDKQLQACKNLPETVEDKQNHSKSYLPTAPKLDFDSHATHASAAASLEFTKDEKCGSNVRAGENIKIGKTLMIEKPFASVLYPGYYDTHCYHCFAQVHVPLPCLKCTAIVFCSQECQEKGMKYHQYECYFLNMLDEPWCGKYGHLAIRMILVLGLEQTMKYFETVGTDMEAPEPDESSKDSHVKEYEACLKLVSHHGQKSKGTRFEKTVLGIFLTKILESSGFFGDGSNLLLPPPPGTKTEEEQEGDGKEEVIVLKPYPKEYAPLATMLLLHNEILQCNAFPITKYEDPECFDNPKPVDIGVGICPTVALVNHSCHPNATREYYGNVSVVRAIASIEQDQQVTVDYGLNFFTVGRSERRKKLKERYYFDCRCEACAKQWPAWKEMEAMVPMFKCQACGEMLNMTNIIEERFAECTKCKKKQNFTEAMTTLQKTHERYAKAVEEAVFGNHEKSVPLLEEHYELMQKYLCQPFKDLVSCQSALAQCYKMRGNKKLSFP